MKVRLMLFTAIVTLLVASVGGAVPGKGKGNANGADNGIHDTRGTQVHDCGDGDTITYDGPITAWPPNHKYRAVTITATEAPDDDSMDTVTLNTMGSHDEVDDQGNEQNGAGHTPIATDVNPPTDMDMGTGSATTKHEFRGERSGRGDGRIYTFKAMATFDDGQKMCDATFTSTVPHDMGHGAGGPPQT